MHRYPIIYRNQISFRHLLRQTKQRIEYFTHRRFYMSLIHTYLTFYLRFTYITHVLNRR